MSHDWRLNLPGNARISTLAFSIWKSGVTPWSWVYQQDPDLLPDPIENRIAYAVEVFLKKLEFDNALLSEIERAKTIADEQGRELKFAGSPANETWIDDETENAP